MQKHTRSTIIHTIATTPPTCTTVSGIKAIGTASLVQMTAMRRADVTIDSYPEYETHLKAEQKHALQQAADVILRSYFTWSPIKAVVVVGHADQALRKPICDRTAFECTISQRRADSTRVTILREISQLTHDAHFHHPCCGRVAVFNYRGYLSVGAQECPQ
jgi:hypothetical protein